MRLSNPSSFVPEVGEWADKKYRLVGNYAAMFSKAMAGKWGATVYLDLFAGSGTGRVKGTDRLVDTSPVRALRATPPFDLYLFCDANPVCIDSLRSRVNNEFPDRNAACLQGDANALVSQIVKTLVQQPGGAISFCLLDPFRLADLHFDTVRQLAELRTDFLVLIPSHMDANRNRAIYAARENSAIERFAGNPRWRDDLKNERRPFGAFLIDQFGRSMQQLGYLYRGPGTEEVVFNPGTRQKLYYLAFYSKHELGMKFWREACKYSAEQLRLFAE